MRDLSTVRQGWDQIEKAEAHLTSRMTPQESFRYWLQLQATFESQLRETSALFGPQRASDLAELQARLRRLAQWQEGHGTPGASYPTPSHHPPAFSPSPRLTSTVNIRSAT